MDGRELTQTGAAALRRAPLQSESNSSAPPGPHDESLNRGAEKGSGSLDSAIRREYAKLFAKGTATSSRDGHRSYRPWLKCDQTFVVQMWRWPFRDGSCSREQSQNEPRGPAAQASRQAGRELARILSRSRTTNLGPPMRGALK